MPTPNTTNVATVTTGMNGHGPRPACKSGRSASATSLSTTQNATTNTGESNAAVAAHANTSARANRNTPPTRSQLTTANTTIKPHLTAGTCHSSQPALHVVNASYANTPTVNTTQISKNSRCADKRLRSDNVATAKLPNKNANHNDWTCESSKLTDTSSLTHAATSTTPTTRRGA